MPSADLDVRVRDADEAPYHLQADDPAGLTHYLRRQGWIAAADEVQSVGPAGDGNMNRTLRVVTRRTRLVVKQGRPWVEKYPQIAAPPDRTLVEAAFYERVAETPGVLIACHGSSASTAPRACSRSTTVPDFREGRHLRAPDVGEHRVRGRVGSHAYRERSDPPPGGRRW